MKTQEGGPYGLLVTSGTGPAEVRAFVAHLAQALEALCVARCLGVDAVVGEGEDAAPRSVRLILSGPAPARLGDLLGTHALISLSPARGRRARKRWFASVTLEAEVLGDAPEVLASEVIFEAIRGGGPGGQHVNKTATTVRAHHLPTGLRVRVSSERSLRANQREALLRLGRQRAALEAAARGDAVARRRAQHHLLVRGDPVRVWRMDHRGRGIVPAEG